MNETLTGGCLCGSTRYACSAEPVMAGNCHCRDCQKASGSGFAPTLFFPAPSVTITGEVKYFDSQGDSGHIVSRGFCPTCGSQLFGKVELMPGLIAIRAGTLDDPTRYRPGADIYTASVQPWDVMNPSLPKFPQMPPE